MRQSDVDPAVVRAIAARALGPSPSLVIARTADGASTPVYRVERGAETFYLRLAEGPDASLGPEVLVHGLLRERGVKVPEVVHYEPCNDAVGRSVMLTTEIPGRSLAASQATVDPEPILVAAGRDLAVVNDLPVAGFGWIRRDRPTPTALAAELPDHRSFALADLDQQLVTLRDSWLSADEVRAIRRTIARHHARLDVPQAHLAHGDFDATHIYQQGGRYTGMIDFGEIRGADRGYDLGHFALHDGETVPCNLLPPLLRGYGEVAPLPAEHETRIHLLALLIGVRALARAAARPRRAYPNHLAAAIRRSRTALAA